MCGIAGIIKFDSNNNIQEHEIKIMLDPMYHRGPDQEGFKIFNDFKNKVSIGNRRLSIVDISNGNQPFSDHQNLVSVVQNGEIYNYKDLKKKLIDLKYNFRTNCDTEVILNLYLEYGESFVKYLDGMFAISIWDTRSKKLLLARDRHGKKPLFYSLKNKKFYFASEIQSIQKNLNDKTVNFDALNSYLTFLTIPQDQCIFAHIHKVQPGHILSIDENSEIKITQYCNDKLNYLAKPNFKDCEIEFERLLKNAVKKRLIGDRDVGCFLSGGLDSSLIAIMLSRINTNGFKTFSAGFLESDFNELPFARQVSKIVDSDHYDIIIKPDIDSIMNKVVRNLGEPYGDSSIVPTFYLSKLASEHVKVVLSGDGGDEIFGGYNHQLAWKISFFLQKIPGLKFLMQKIPGAKIINRDQTLTSKIKRMLGSVKYEGLERYANYHTIFTESEKKKLFKLSDKPLEVNLDLLNSHYNNFEKMDNADICLRLDQKWLLPNDFLVKMDTASMANSLEVRSPLLDNELVDFANSLPPDWKINFYNKKFFLKNFLKEKLPHKLINRKKQGFNVPINHWIKNDLKDYFYSKIIEGNFIKENLNLDYIKEIYTNHVLGYENNSNKLWLLYVLEMWSKEFLEGGNE